MTQEKTRPVIIPGGGWFICLRWKDEHDQWQYRSDPVLAWGGVVGTEDEDMKVTSLSPFDVSAVDGNAEVWWDENLCRLWHPDSKGDHAVKTHEQAIESMEAGD